MATKKETVYTTVTMDDGRIVEFAGKRKMAKEAIFGKDGSIQIRADFVNGETRFLTLNDKLLAEYAAHGASQKLGDEIAGIEDVEDAVMAIDELLDRLHAGDWSVKRAGAEMAGTSVLAKALIEVTGKAPADIKAFLSGKTQAEKLALRQNPKIAPIVQRIEAEKASKKEVVDTEALLSELA